jgi:putative oxidoreductase
MVVNATPSAYLRPLQPIGSLPTMCAGRSLLCPLVHQGACRSFDGDGPSAGGLGGKMPDGAGLLHAAAPRKQRHRGAGRGVTHVHGRNKMNKFEALGQSWSARLLSVLRIVTAFLFVQHGTAKLFQIPHVAGLDGVSLMSLIGLAGALELAGGLLLLIGLFTRPVAFLLSGEMAFAYFIAHAPSAFLPLLNGGELAVEWCFVFLYIWAAGSGAWSVDAWRSAQR